MVTIKKLYYRLLWVVSILCWLGAVVPVGYVFVEAVKSMGGTMHGFNGEMLYGMDAFMDTVVLYIVLGFPSFIVWGICLLGAIVSIVGLCVCHYMKKRDV